MKQKKSRIALGVAAFLALLIALSVIWYTNQPEPQSDEKSIVVEVVHKDGSEKEFSYQTDLEYLGDLLKEEGLISGTEGEFGIFVNTVDGELADYSVDSGWWKLSCNGEDSQTGADYVVIQDGAIYTWTYTIG